MIVVGTDGSESAAAALETAIELASASGDELVVVTAWRPLHGDFGVPYDRLLDPSSAEIERDWAGETAEAAAARARAAGADVRVEIREGDAAKAICDVAREADARLVVVGTHGAGPLEAAILGSVSRGVLRRAPCSVLVALRKSP